MSKPSRTEFIGQVEQLITARFPLVKLQRNENEFSLRINGHWTSLENLYRMSTGEFEEEEYTQRLQKNVERWVVELLRAAEGTPDQTATFDELRERIFPVVLSQGRRDVSGMAMITQQLLPGLIVGYALDSTRTMSYIPRKAFEDWSITIDQLHEAALENLMMRSETLQAHASPDETGQVNLILIQTMDGYDASRILLPGLHEHLREYLDSPFLAAIPNRDILICFRNDVELIDRLRPQIMEDFKTMPHQVSDGVFLVTPDGIAPFDPPAAASGE